MGGTLESQESRPGEGEGMGEGGWGLGIGGDFLRGVVRNSLTGADADRPLWPLGTLTRCHYGILEITGDCICDGRALWTNASFCSSLVRAWEGGTLGQTVFARPSTTAAAAAARCTFRALSGEDRSPPDVRVKWVGFACGVWEVEEGRSRGGGGLYFSVLSCDALIFLDPVRNMALVGWGGEITRP